MEELPFEIIPKGRDKEAVTMYKYLRWRLRKMRRSGELDILVEEVLDKLRRNCIHGTTE